MSVTQTYYLADTARVKLSSEAARADHNLRLIVGHANLLASLMLELAKAKQEQKNWFNQSVKRATGTEKSRKHIQWANTVIREPKDWQAEDADSNTLNGEYDLDKDIEMESPSMVLLQRIPSHTIASIYTDDEEEVIKDDGEEYLKGLALYPALSGLALSLNLPELDQDSSDDSLKDESISSSPLSTTLPSFSEKQRQQIATTSFYNLEPQSC